MNTCCNSKPITISSSLSFNDHLGHFLFRVGINRSQLIVAPGIYAVGKPDNNSPVFISANFTMSFNLLRQSLSGINSWILVIDTKGINVWCAAGKGTFGTQEIVNKITKYKLKDVVTHRKIIIPQLGAPGTSAKLITQATGFNVIFGPVDVKDIKAFLENGLKATREMRRINFPIKDRLVLIPMELVLAMKYALPTIALITIAGLQLKLIDLALYFIWSIIITVTAGNILTPIFLLIIPFRSFFLKGWTLATVSLILFNLFYQTQNLLLTTGTFLLFPALAGYLAYNFTGCSTFTSQSGVEREMKLFIIPFLILTISGMISIILGLIGI